MTNIIIIEKEFKFINRIINIIYSIDNAKLKSIHLSFDKYLESTFGLPNTAYIISEEMYFSNINKIPKNITLIVLTQNIIKAKVNNNILFLSSNVADSSLKKNLISYLQLDTRKVLESKLYKLLTSFKFDFSLKGTVYLYDSILYCSAERKDFLCENLERNVYSVIANKYNTTVGNIKWSIVRSINRMIDTSPTNTKLLRNYFKLDDDSKLTAKLLICLFTNKFIKI